MKARKLLFAFLAKWADAKINEENGILTQRHWGRYDAHNVEHGWWLVPYQWGLGVSAERYDWLPAGFGGKFLVSVHVGPFIWGATFSQPARPVVRRQAVSS